MIQEPKLSLLHHPPPGKGGRSMAFSLVELLVLVAVIAILAALFLPALAKARQQAHIVQCANNLQQAGICFQVYTGEYNGRLMRSYYGRNREEMEIGYDEKLAPYGTHLGVCTNKSKVFTCPSQRLVNYPHQPGYGMNWFYDNQVLSAQAENFQAILLAETLGPTGTGSHRADRDNGILGALDTRRHIGFANYLFLDGHTELASLADTFAPVGLWGDDPKVPAKTAPTDHSAPDQ